ncbi:MAG: response regulator transcription factor [Kiritimatiellia bacterium]|jgi:DNA-binding response OmpR family regulator|nr:response regulator transcription factor [Kiritimatiellia bacterium]MDP6848569.1 response regulator transcription factor [Kiritimatiellia bacterium]
MAEQQQEKRILIVEDDIRTANLVALYLRNEGFITDIAHDGTEAMEMAARLKPMFVVLDLMLPELDGWEVCRRLRKVSDVPILILTARDEEGERIKGLSLGADDYVVKPFSPGELVARVQAILRRYTPRKNADGVFSHNQLSLDPVRKKVTLRGTSVSITPSEYILLHTLMSTPGKVFSRDELISRLYPDGDDVIGRVVDVHMGELREKIEKDRTKPEYILTVRGFGYQFADTDTP